MSNNKLFTQIRSRIWNEGGTLIPDRALEVAINIIVKECVSHINSLQNGNFYVIADEVKQHFGVK